MVVRNRLKIKSIVVYFISFFIASSAFGYNVSDTLEVTTSVLNLRSEPNADSEIVAKINQGETLIVKKDLSEWVQVSTKKYHGFVSSEYVEKVASLGFYDWFKDGWLYGSMIIFILVFGGQVAAARVKDNRFKEGYRQGVVGEGKLIKAIIGSAVTGLLIGVGYAIYMWFKN